MEKGIFVPKGSTVLGIDCIVNTAVRVEHDCGVEVLHLLGAGLLRFESHYTKKAYLKILANGNCSWCSASQIQ